MGTSKIKHRVEFPIVEGIARFTLEVVDESLMLYARESATGDKRTLMTKIPAGKNMALVIEVR